MSKKATNDLLRADWTAKVEEWLFNLGEEVLRVNGNEVAIPVVDSEGEDNFVVFTIKVPSGSRDGEAYDGYGLAQDYEMRVKEREEKAKVKAEEKARKIARDEAMRAQRAAAKAAHEQNKQ